MADVLVNILPINGSARVDQNLDGLDVIRRIRIALIFSTLGREIKGSSIGRPYEMQWHTLHININTGTSSPQKLDQCPFSKIGGLA